jgi:hypothetical protein
MFLRRRKRKNNSYTIIIRDSYLRFYKVYEPKDKYVYRNKNTGLYISYRIGVDDINTYKSEYDSTLDNAMLFNYYNYIVNINDICNYQRFSYNDAAILERKLKLDKINEIYM